MNYLYHDQHSSWLMTGVHFFRLEDDVLLSVRNRVSLNKFENQECQTLAWPAVLVFRPFIKENMVFSDQISYIKHILGKMHQLDYLSAPGCYIFATQWVDTSLGHFLCLFDSGHFGHITDYGHFGHLYLKQKWPIIWPSWVFTQRV